MPRLFLKAKFKSQRWDKKGRKLDAQLRRMIEDIEDKQEEERERRLWVAKCKKLLLEKKQRMQHKEQQRQHEGREREPRVSRIGSDHLWRAVEESVDIDPDLHDSDLGSLNLRGDTGVPFAPPTGVPFVPPWPRWARSSDATSASASASASSAYDTRNQV